MPPPDLADLLVVPAVLSLRSSYSPRLVLVAGQVVLGLLLSTVLDEPIVFGLGDENKATRVDVPHHLL